MNEKEAYVHLLHDTLKKKVTILTSLLDETKEQELLLTSDKMDTDKFEQILSQKKEQIDILNEMDEGFDSIYRRVKDEFSDNMQKYKDIILQMQNLIKKITDLGLQIQSLEHKNSAKFKLYVAGEKSHIKEVKMNSKMATSYYQNMANQHHSDDSYFFNTKK